MSAFSQTTAGPDGPITVYFEEITETHEQTLEFAREDLEMKALNSKLPKEANDDEEGGTLPNIMEVDLNSGSVVRKSANVDSALPSSSSSSSSSQSQSSRTKSKYKSTCLATTASLPLPPRGGCTLTAINVTPYTSQSSSLSGSNDTETSTSTRTSTSNTDCIYLLQGGCDKYGQFYGVSGSVGHEIYYFNPKRTTWVKVKVKCNSPPNSKSDGGPSDRSSHTTIYDHVNNKLYVYGGVETNEFESEESAYDLGDLWVTSVDISESDVTIGKWINLTPERTASVSTSKRSKRTSIKPKGRNSHATVLHDSCLITSFGTGYAFPTRLTSEILVYDIDANLWDVVSLSPSPAVDETETETETTNDDDEKSGGLSSSSSSSSSPQAREMHVMITTKDAVYILGGRGIDGVVLSDFWSLSSTSSSTSSDSKASRKWNWTKLPSSPTPRCSFGGVSITDDTSLLFFGGFDGVTSLYSNLMSFHIPTSTWTTVDISNGPCSRFAFNVCNYSSGGSGGGGGGEGLVVFGGMDFNGEMGDLVFIDVDVDANV